MFQHCCANHRLFTWTKESMSNMLIQVMITLTFQELFQLQKWGQSVPGLACYMCIPLLRWTPWGWHSSAATWIVFYDLYFIECICWLIYWIHYDFKWADLKWQTVFVRYNKNSICILNCCNLPFVSNHSLYHGTVPLYDKRNSQNMSLL